MTKLTVLRKLKEYMSDPDHVVLNPLNVYEDSEGKRIPEFDKKTVTRGCLLGCVTIIMGGKFSEGVCVALTQAANDLFPSGWNYDDLMGNAAYLPVIERAIQESK